MTSFVNIIPVYNTDIEKNVDFLSQKYDVDELRICIEPSIHQFIGKGAVCGKKVLLKPNWIKHCTRANDEICLCTHPNFVTAVVMILLKWSPKSIIHNDR